ncbi:MAG: hypothetical protein IJK58_03660 [Clostridia bacterium]|nr:hypothetical protein [Clostridia bacterium]
MKVLIAAPDRDLLDSLSGLLALRGWEADAAHDGAMAAEKSRAVRYGAALVDEKIPLIRSADLIKEFEESGIPAILMTEDPGARGDAVIKYPFTPEELFSVIGRVAAGKEKTENE